MSNFNCLNCGKPFKRILPSYNRKYCCRECYSERRRENPSTPAERSRKCYHNLNKHCPVCGKPIMNKATHCREHVVFPDRKGEKHPQWKGGKFKNYSGYVVIRKGGKAKREHIFVWEQSNGKFLPKGWIIHHLNGIRNDNRIENLVAMPRKNHEPNTFAKVLQKRIRELEQLHLPI